MKNFNRILPLVLLFLLTACAQKVPVRPDQLSFAPLEFELPQVEKLELTNGINLYLREDHELPLVSVTAQIGAGAISDPAEKTGLGGLFATLLRTGGAGTLGPEQLDDELEYLAAQVSASSDTYTTTVDMSLRSEDLARGLQILADVMRSPAFDANRLTLARLQAIEGIRRQDDDPGSVASRALMRALYGDHPLGRTPTVETINLITREDLVAFHTAHFKPQNLSLGISGDFDPVQLIAELQELLGDWPKGQSNSQTIPPIEPAAPAAVWVAEKDIPQTTLLFGEIGIDKDSPDLHPVRVMNYILGGGGFNSRLLREVRSNRGLAYSVYSYYQIGRLLPGPFIAGCETKSESTLEVARLMREIMENMRQQQVSQDDLEMARESLINSFVFAFTDSHDIVTRRMRMDFFNYPEDYLETYRQQVAAVSVEDVLRVARKYLNPERQAVVLVGKTGAFDGSVETLGLPVRLVNLQQPTEPEP